MQIEIVKNRFAPDGKPDVDKIQHGDHRPSVFRAPFVSIYIDMMRGEARRIKG